MDKDIVEGLKMIAAANRRFQDLISAWPDTGGDDHLAGGPSSNFGKKPTDGAQAKANNSSPFAPTNPWQQRSQGNGYFPSQPPSPSIAAMASKPTPEAATVMMGPAIAAYYAHKAAADKAAKEAAPKAPPKDVTAGFGKKVVAGPSSFGFAVKHIGFGESDIWTLEESDKKITEKMDIRLTGENIPLLATAVELTQMNIAGRVGAIITVLAKPQTLTVVQLAPGTGIPARYTLSGMVRDKGEEGLTGFEWKSYMGQSPDNVLQPNQHEALIRLHQLVLEAGKKAGEIPLPE